MKGRPGWKRWLRGIAAAAALLTTSSRSGGRSRFVRQWARYPLEYQATLAFEAVPEISIGELLTELDIDSFRIDASSAGRHSWNLGELEQIVLWRVIRSLEARRVFEIGTFDGATTRLLASALPDDAGQVFTLDLPPSEFDATQNAPDFESSMVGCQFRGAPEAARITQLLHDSARLDFSEWRDSIDVVLVDGAHDYDHGFSDSRAALEIVRPGGMIFWDDFSAHWHGLVLGIVEATAGLPLRRVRGLNFAFLRSTEGIVIDAGGT